MAIALFAHDVGANQAQALLDRDIFIGVNHVDYSGYPDCRPAFMEALTQLANVTIRAGVQGDGHFKVHAPLIEMDKGAIIAAGASISPRTPCLAMPAWSRIDRKD